MKIKIHTYGKQKAYLKNSIQTNAYPLIISILKTTSRALNLVFSRKEKLRQNI